MVEFPKRNKNKWTVEEEEILTKNYAIMGRKVAQFFPDRSYQSVSRKIENLGLLKAKPLLPDPEPYDVGLIRKTLKFNEPVAIALFGDWHISRFTNEARLQEYVDFFKETESIKHRKKEYLLKIILMGDLMENGLPSSIGTSARTQGYEPYQQKEIVIDIINQLRDKIIGIHAGNHEERTFKAVGEEPIRDICRETKTERYGHGTFTYLDLGNQEYSLYTWHGRSGAQFTWTKLNSCIRAGMAIDADVIGMGHVHDKASSSQTLLTAKGVRYKTYVLSGHFLRWIDSYAQRLGLTLGKDGASIIYFDNERFDIDVEA